MSPAIHNLSAGLLNEATDERWFVTAVSVNPFR